MPRLLVDNLTFGYTRKQPLFLNLSVDLGGEDGRGRVIAIIGRSGCGKSTLLRLLAGLEKPWEGVVRCWPEVPQLAFLPQEAVLFEQLSIGENARYFQRIRAVKDRVTEENVRAIAAELGLTSILTSGRMVGELSGGERQRIALLRALSLQPDVVCLDEPCSGLDVGLKREFLLSLRSSVERRNVLALYVTHHADEAQMVADDVVFIYKDETERAIIWKDEIGLVLRNSPHVSMRQFFGGPTLNTLKCSLTEGLVKVVNGGSPLGSTVPVAEALGALVLFPPERVKWNMGGVPVTWTANSGCYSFCDIDVDGERIQIIGPRHADRPVSCMLDGPVDVFEKSGSFFQSVIVKPVGLP